MMVRLEDDILSEHEARWERQGYQVLRASQFDRLPDELRLFQPDAVLRRDNENVAVEIVYKGDAKSAKKVEWLRNVILSIPNWRLEVVYAGSGEDQFEAAGFEDIRKTIDSAYGLKENDSRAAFLLLWATMEAIVRGLLPVETRRPQSPGRVVELLAREGVLLPDEAARLRELSRKRNMIVHGGLGYFPTSEEIDFLVSIAKNTYEKALDQGRGGT